MCMQINQFYNLSLVPERKNLRLRFGPCSTQDDIKRGRAIPSLPFQLERLHVVSKAAGF